MPDGQEQDNTPRTFTQEELDRIVGERIARARREARTEFEQQLKEQLGDVDLKDLITTYQQHREQQEAAKTEAQKALEAAQKAQQEAEAVKATAARELHRGRVELALLEAGAPKDGIEAINVPVEVGATVEEIKAAVEELKSRLPGLFTAGPQVPDADPGKPPARREATEWGAEGLAQFQARFGQKQPA